MTVLITLTTAGSGTGPFNLFSDVNGFTTPFQTGVAKSTLVAGYYDTSVPDNTTIIRVVSTGTCNTQVELPVAGAPATTTTTTTAGGGTTTTTTTIFGGYTLAEEATYANPTSGCSLGTTLRIYLDSVDYAAFIANGNMFGGLGGGASTTCTALARNSSGVPISGYLYDTEGVCWKLTAGHFTYNNFQC